MTTEEIINLIDQKIAGQGTMVDVGGALPTILKEIVDMAQNAGPAAIEGSDKQTIPAGEWDEQIKGATALKIGDSVYKRCDAFFLNDSVVTGIASLSGGIGLTPKKMYAIFCDGNVDVASPNKYKGRFYALVEGVKQNPQLTDTIYLVYREVDISLS